VRKDNPTPAYSPVSDHANQIKNKKIKKSEATNKQTGAVVNERRPIDKKRSIARSHPFP
jgi:hypothetical protein